MIFKATILVALQVLAFVTQVTASEMTASLASKVEESDLVAIIKITAVERGQIHVPEDWYSTAQDFKMNAAVVDRIKGVSPDTIIVSAYSTSYTRQDEDGQGTGTIFSTAGFSAYSIEPGKSYIAYLREDGEGRYRLGWNSNQFLEVISADGVMVNDIGQTRDQVRLAPKLRKLRALASVVPVLTFVTHPIFLGATLATGVLVCIWIIRKKRLKKIE